MDDNIIIAIVYFMFFGWIPILAIAKAISMIIKNRFINEIMKEGEEDFI